MDILELLQTIGTLLEGLATIGALIYAGKQFQEMRREHEERERPYIIADFEVSNSLIEVAIVNMGKGAAKDVKFSFEPELIASDGRNLSKSFWLFREGTAFFPPDKKISTFFDTSPAYFNSGNPLIFDAKISYQDMRGKLWETSMKLDLSMYKGRMFIRYKGIDDIAKTMEKIERHIKKALAPLGRGVLVKTQEDVDRQIETIRECREENENA